MSDEETWDPEIHDPAYSGDVRTPVPYRRPLTSPAGVVAPGGAAGRTSDFLGQPRPDMVRPRKVELPATTEPKADSEYEHYRDGGTLPWWAWAGIGAVVTGCGLLAFAAVAPPNIVTAEFDPRLSTDYSTLDVLPVDGVFESTVGQVSWAVDIESVSWFADLQARIDTSMPEPANGMKYVAVEVDIVTEFPNMTPMDEALFLTYLAPSGQEYTVHYCSSGCLADPGPATYETAGWVYFEVPRSEPAGGHLRIKLLYSGTADILMELR